MKILFLLTALTLANLSFGQTKDLVDSISNKVCKALETSSQKHALDSNDVYSAFGEELKKLTSRFSDNQLDSIGEDIFFRLQRECNVFRDFLSANSNKSEYFSTTYTKPNSNITQAECDSFFTNKDYWYYEATGDTTFVRLDSAHWIDTFKDKTYSKLKVRNHGQCTFQIEFQESNNRTRSKLSRQGDIYEYTLLEKKQGYFLLAARVPGSSRYSIFKIYQH